MASFKERLDKLEDTKYRMKDKLIKYGVSNPGDVLSTYADKIRQMKHTINIDTFNTTGEYLCDGIACADGTYVAISSSQYKILYSTDTITWYLVDLFTNILQDIKYINNRFVARVGYNYMQSDDGITWSSLTSDFGSVTYPTSIIYENGIYLVGAYCRSDTASSRYNLYSNDNGVTWNQTMTRTKSYGWEAGYIDGNYILANKQTGSVYYSTDCITWTFATLPEGLSVNKLVYSPTRILLISYAGSVHCYSDDGITWTPVLLPADSPKVIYANGKFIMSADTGYYTSTDGITWTAGISDSSILGASLCYDNDNSRAIGVLNGTIVYSNDLANWYKWVNIPAYTERVIHQGEWLYSTVPEEIEEIAGVMYKNNMFILYGGTKIGLSTDVSNWTVYDLPFSFGSTGKLKYTNGYYIAGSYYSTNCINWTTAGNPDGDTTEENYPWRDMYYQNNKFVWVGYYWSASNDYWYGYATKSVGGTTWTKTVYRWSSDGNAYYHGGFLDDGGSGVIIVAPGGVDSSQSTFYMTTDGGSTWTSTSVISKTRDILECNDNSVFYNYDSGYASAQSMYGPYRDVVTNLGPSLTATSIIGYYPTSIAYGDNKYIAVNSGDESHPFYTLGVTDGVYGTSWTAMGNRPQGTNWNRICYGNGKFVLVQVGVNDGSKKLAYTATSDTSVIVHIPENGTTICPSCLTPAILGYRKSCLNKVTVLSDNTSITSSDFSCFIEGDKLYISHSATITDFSMIDSPDVIVDVDTSNTSGRVYIYTIIPNIPVTLHILVSGTVAVMRVRY